jgi:hypothetical protein
MMTDTLTPKKKRTNGRGMKAKGDAYERDLARLIDDTIFASRGQVFRAPLSGGGRNIGGGGRADISGTPTIWIEAKRTERFSPYEALAQAERGIAASRTPDAPVVISRRNRMPDTDSLVVMRLSDWLPLYAAHLASLGYTLSPSPCAAPPATFDPSTLRPMNGVSPTEQLDG